MNEGPLEALAARLVVPARSGLYLTRSDLIVLARLSEGSLRVSDRKRMLLDVLRSPQDVRELGALVNRLADLCHHHLRGWADLVAAYPRAERHAAPWTEKLRGTLALLEGMNEELAATVPRGGPLERPGVQADRRPIFPTDD